MRSSPAEGLVPEYRMVFRSGDTERPEPDRASNRFSVSCLPVAKFRNLNSNANGSFGSGRAT